MASPAAGMTILIVDDDEQARGSLMAFLGSVLPDARIETAGDPQKALAMLEASPVDIVLSDHRMPGMTGYEFLQRVRQVSPEAGRLLMTGLPEVDLAKRALNEGGVHRFFTKPLDPDEILDAIEELQAAGGA